MKEGTLLSTFREIAGKSESFDILQARIRTDRNPLFPYDLDAIVIGGIMAGGNHETAVQSVMESTEIHHFRAAETDVIYIGARIHKTLCCGLADFSGTGPHIEADAHGFGMIQRSIGPAHPIGQLFVHLTGHNPPDIISFKSLMGHM